MKKLTNADLQDLAEKKKNVNDYKHFHKLAITNFTNGYREAEEKHLKTIAKLQKILKSHRIVIDVMYAPKAKK